MLKWKNFRLPTVNAGDETLVDALAGMSGKSRRIVSLVADRTSNVYIRVYKDAEQIVDLESNLLTSYAPFLAMDLPLAEGELCKIGFYAKSGGISTPDIAIGYEEAG